MNGVLRAIGLTLFGGGCLGVEFGIGRIFRPAANAEPTTQASDAPAATVATVQVESLKRGSLDEQIIAYGTIQPASASAFTLSAPFDAIVARVLTSAGSQVRAGAPLLELSPTPELLLQLQQSRDALAAANTTLDQARRRRDQQLATNSDVLSAEQVQRVAQTQVQSLEQRGVGRTTTITAAVAGVVTQVNVQAGQSTTSGTALAVISPQTDLFAVVGVDPPTADGLHVDAPVEVTDLHDADQKPTLGQINSIRQQIDPQSRLRDVIIALPNDAHALQGAFVVASLHARHGEGFIVPRSAVTPDDDARVLFTVAAGKAVRHEVQVSLSDKESMLVNSDALHEADAIVVAGNAELEDGMAVTIAPATAPASSPSAEEK